MPLIESGSGSWLQCGTGIYYNLGTVGIGVSLPQVDLDVWDTNDPGSTGTLNLHGNGGNSDTAIGFFENYAAAMKILCDGVDNQLYFKDETQDKIRVTFERGGDVGIGITSPAAKLHVYGDTSQPGLVVRGGDSSSPYSSDLMTLLNGAGVEQFWFNGGGNAGARGSWGTFSPYISMYFIPDDREKNDYQVGDLVSAIDSLAVKTRVVFDQAVVGVICPPEGFISIPTELKKAITEEGKSMDDFKLVPVAYPGDVRVKVNSEGGSIRSGDLIVPSSVPGESMKGEPETFKQYASVIGKARENFDDASGLIWISVGVK